MKVVQNDRSPFKTGISNSYTFLHYRESVAGFVIQATGTVEFEDGLWIGNQLKARNDLQRVCPITGVL